MLLNKANILFFITILVVLRADAQAFHKTKKGFEALEIHDYFKSKQLFEKALKKNKSAASYGLSVIYARNNNPFYNLDSAAFYVHLADSNYVILTQKKQEKLCAFSLDKHTIQHQRNLIDSLCFLQATNLNTIESYNHFLTKNKNAKQQQKAIEIRNTLAFNLARTKNKSEAIVNFINTYPAANEIEWAKKLLDSLVYKEYTTPLTIKNLEKFITEKPNNVFFTKAEEQLYELVTKPKTEEAYFTFIKKYPDNSNHSRAWRNLYSISTSDYNPESINEFIKKYPQYPFLYELEKDFKLAKAIFYPFMINNKWGFLDDNLKEVVAANYEYVNLFNEGVAAAKKHNKYGFIDKSNKIAVPFKYDEVEDFANGLAVVGINEKYGIINKVGEEIVPLIYDEIGTTKNKFIAVGLNEKYGFIDNRGKLVVGLEYDAVGYFNNGLAYVKKNDLYGIIDTNLYYIAKHQFNWIDNLDNDFIRVRKDNLYGVINQKGETILPLEYQQITEPENGLALVVKNNLYGYINKKGEIKIPITIAYSEGVINWALFNKSGYARFAAETKMGLIDTLGKKFLPALFEDVGAVSDNLIAVKRNGKWGYCDYNAKLKIPYNFQEAGAFINGFAIVKQNNLVGCINNKGSIIIPFEYEELGYFTTKLLLAKKEGKFGLINLEKEVLIPFQYQKIEFSFDKKFIRLATDEEVKYSIAN